MRAVSAAASGARHAGGALVEAGLIVAIGGALAIGVGLLNGNPAGADAVLAGKGAHGGHTSTAATSAIILDQSGSVLRLGSSVTFTTRVAGLKGGEYPMVYVACFAPETGAILYSQLDHPDVTFVLGGGSSRWWAVGGPANCKAHLYAYGGKTAGGYDDIRELTAPVAFEAAR